MNRLPLRLFGFVVFFLLTWVDLVYLVYLIQQPGLGLAAGLWAGFVLIIAFGCFITAFVMLLCPDNWLERL